MTVLPFTDKSLPSVNREAGISNVPLPPAYAITDMERANQRFIGALAISRDAVLFPPQMVRQARLDYDRYRELIPNRLIDGVPVISVDDVVRFVHYVTGHPRAWVLSWQLHSMKAFLHVHDGSGRTNAFPEQARIANEAFAAGFNREL